MFDITLINIRLVDPVNAVNKKVSIAIDDGKIAELSEGPLTGKSKKELDMEGKVAVPGIIDIHTHVTNIFGGSEGGFFMLARAGVCTTLDMAGPTVTVFDTLARYGAGINVAVLESIRPGVNIRSNAPSLNELRGFICSSMENAAVGCKLLGGHYPLTPESSHDFVEVAELENAYAAWHAGTTQSVNTIDSFRDLVMLADGHRLHAAHINTYCRGFQLDEIMEAREAIALLEKNPNIWSEAYLAQTNGINFRLDEKGRLKSRATGQTLIRAGFEDSRQGIVNALRAGFAHVFAPRGIETGIYHGEEAVKLLFEYQCDIAGGFDVNPPLSRLFTCLARRSDGSFAVDALSTDGGAIPRNVIVSHGLSLVNMEMLSLEDFVWKTSVAPAAMLGLKNKGQLGVGADADITVLDLEQCKPVMTVVGGNICMYAGLIIGNGGTIITTERGKKAASAFGLPLCIVEPGNFLPKRGWGRAEPEMRHGMA